MIEFSRDRSEDWTWQCGHAPRRAGGDAEQCADDGAARELDLEVVVPRGLRIGQCRVGGAFGSVARGPSNWKPDPLTFGVVGIGVP